MVQDINMVDLVNIQVKNILNFYVHYKIKSRTPKAPTHKKNNSHIKMI